MTESTWKCACGKDNALGATVCILCKTPHAPEHIEDSHLTGSVSRITGTITGLLLLAFVVWFGLLTGGGSVFAGIFVVVVTFSIGLIGFIYFGNEPSVRHVLHWLFPFASRRARLAWLVCLVCLVVVMVAVMGRGVGGVNVNPPHGEWIKSR